jgi:DNA modification methylase
MRIEEQIQLFKNKYGSDKVHETKYGYIIQGDSLQVLDELNLNADLVILDPPYFDATHKLAVGKPQVKIFESKYGYYGDKDVIEPEYTHSELLRIAHQDPLLANWKKPKPYELVYTVKRNLKHTGLIFLFGFMPHLVDYHLELERHDYKFMYEIIWAKTRNPSLGNGLYPNRVHTNIWVYRQSDVRLQDTHHNIKSVCQCYNNDIVVEDITERLNGTLPKARIKSKGYITAREYVGYPKSVIDAGAVNYTTNKEEYIGHPTQIPTSLLELIIKMSTYEGDLVLDPYFGSGTTGVVCTRLKRRYIGIEITEEWFNKSYERILKEEKEIIKEPTNKLTYYL